MYLCSFALFLHSSVFFCIFLSSCTYTSTGLLVCSSTFLCNTHIWLFAKLLWSKRWCLVCLDLRLLTGTISAPAQMPFCVLLVPMLTATRLLPSLSVRLYCLSDAIYYFPAGRVVLPIVVLLIMIIPIPTSPIRRERMSAATEKNVLVTAHTAAINIEGISDLISAVALSSTWSSRIHSLYYAVYRLANAPSQISGPVNDHARCSVFQTVYMGSSCSFY